MLRFVHVKNLFSDTLSVCPAFPQPTACARLSFRLSRSREGTPTLFRRVCDGGSTPVRWSRFLRCHYVRVGVCLGGQSFSKEVQNSVERFTEKIHQVTPLVAHLHFTPRGLQPFSASAAQEPSGNHHGRARRLTAPGRTISWLTGDIFRSLCDQAPDCPDEVQDGSFGDEMVWTPFTIHPKYPIDLTKRRFLD
jgi:hypothetical protein